MLTWKAPLIQGMVLSPLLQSSSFTSLLMLGTSSAKDHSKGLGIHTQAGIRGWLQRARRAACRKQSQHHLSQFPSSPELPTAAGSCCPAIGQGEHGTQLLPKQPQAPSFSRQEGCPDTIFPLDGKHCLQNSLSRTCGLPWEKRLRKPFPRAKPGGKGTDAAQDQGWGHHGPLVFSSSCFFCRFLNCFPFPPAWFLPGPGRAIPHPVLVGLNIPLLCHFRCLS